MKQLPLSAPGAQHLRAANDLAKALSREGHARGVDAAVLFRSASVSGTLAQRLRPSQKLRAAVAAGARIAGGPAMGKSILVIDDNWDIRQTLAELLREEGQAVMTATDGWDGLRKLEDVRRPCLIFLDLMMPRMSGLEFLAHLGTRLDRADFDVVVMSAHDALRRESQQFPNVRATVRKPFDVEELLSLVSGRASGRAPRAVSQ